MIPEPTRPDLPGRRPGSAWAPGRAGAVGTCGHHCARVATAAGPDIQERLRTDRAFYALNCLKVVDENGELVPLKPRKAQTKLYRALAYQRSRGLPQRVIYLKSRKVGVSTGTQGIGIQDCTQNANWKGLVVAQDNDTAGELFDIGSTMYAHLPEFPDVKPPLYQQRNALGGYKLLHWGEPSRIERAKGNLGLNSFLKIDTAKEVDAGRGKTIFFLHLSEAAYYPYEGKTVSLLNAVPDRPDTVVVVESTANGHNSFKRRWDAAMRGEGGYIAVFLGWTDDENCSKAFPDPDERERFVESIGRGDWGADEPRLIEKFAATPEQLYWRRTTIVDKCESKLEFFRQEYPASPEEAFVGSGKHVFSIVLIQRAVDRAEAIERLPVDKGGPEAGVFKETATRTKRIPDGEVEVPDAAIWVPAEATGFAAGHEFWRRWQSPDEEEEEPGQYIVSVDPAGGEDNTSGQGAFHGIEVIDHRSREQVAEYEGRRLDHDQLAREALLAALAYNEALISVETTGGHGWPVVRWLWSRGYRRLYRRRSADREELMKTLGWDTSMRTKPLMEATMTQMLREGTHGIRSLRLALQLTTYVVKDNGKHEPDEEAFADLLMAYMQAQQVASEERLRISGAGEGPVSTWTRTIDPRLGW